MNKRERVEYEPRDILSKFTFRPEERKVHFN